MKSININKQEGVNLLLYPDNQPHVNIAGVNEGDEVKVVCSLTDSIKLVQLLEVANAIDNLFAKKKVLVIPYLMGARFDRLMQPGDSIDLKAIADMINSCGFEKVFLLDVHSDTATLLIKNAVNIPNDFLVKSYDNENSVLICPDAGASKKVGKYLELNKNITDVVYCTKSRDLSNGNLKLAVLEPEKCTAKTCVVIDDLCDGGGTFLQIAQQITPYHLTLIVTHGVFSKGFAALEKYYHKIITTDSYCRSYNSNIVTTLNCPI